MLCGFHDITGIVQSWRWHTPPTGGLECTPWQLMPMGKSLATFCLKMGPPVWSWMCEMLLHLPARPRWRLPTRSWTGLSKTSIGWTRRPLKLTKSWLDCSTCILRWVDTFTWIQDIYVCTCILYSVFNISEHNCVPFKCAWFSKSMAFERRKLTLVCCQPWFH